jgi:hypothetical protein
MGHGGAERVDGAVRDERDARVVAVEAEEEHRHVTGL